MGLELVEIVMEVEDTFGIRLHDDEAGEIVTPGDLCDLIVKRLRARDAYPCLSAGVFFRLRNAFVTTTGMNPVMFRPSTRLTDLLPRRGRRRLWNTIGRAAGLELPALRRLQRMTVAGGVRTVVDHNYGPTEVRSITWQEEQIWARLQEIIASTLGVEAASITREAHLVRDLGCG